VVRLQGQFGGGAGGAEEEGRGRVSGWNGADPNTPETVVYWYLQYDVLLMSESLIVTSSTVSVTDVDLSVLDEMKALLLMLCSVDVDATLA